MRLGLRLVLLATLLAAVARGTPPEATTTQELTSLLHQFMEAASKSDRAVFDKFFADDVIYTRASGVVITKADIMASIAKAAAAGAPKEKTTYSAQDITVHEYGDTAIVAFRLEGHTEGNDGKILTAHYRNTGTFLRRAGRWQAVAWQATKMGDGEPASR